MLKIAFYENRGQTEEIEMFVSKIEEFLSK